MRGCILRCGKVGGCHIVTYCDVASSVDAISLYTEMWKVRWMPYRYILRCSKFGGMPYCNVLRCSKFGGCHMVVYYDVASLVDAIL